MMIKLPSPLDLRRIGIGTDIENVERFKKLDRSEHRIFLGRVFTQGELDYAFSKNSPAAFLAARFAAKEATVKALFALDKPSLEYHDIEVLKMDNGRPVLKLHPISLQDITTSVSLSHSKEHAMAFVIASKNEKEPSHDERRDPQ